MPTADEVRARRKVDHLGRPRPGLGPLGRRPIQRQLGPVGVVMVEALEVGDHDRHFDVASGAGSRSRAS